MFILILGQNIAYLNFNDIQLSRNVTLTFWNRLGLYIYDHCKNIRVASLVINENTDEISFYNEHLHKCFKIFSSFSTTINLSVVIRKKCCNEDSPSRQDILLCITKCYKKNNRFIMQIYLVCVYWKGYFAWIWVL